MRWKPVPAASSGSWVKTTELPLNESRTFFHSQINQPVNLTFHFPTMPPRILLPLALLLAACGQQPEGGAHGGMQMPPAPVTLASVETRELVEWEEFTGRVEAVETVELRPRVSGYITEVHFQAGALVKKGEVLFTIDQRPFETKLRAAKAELRRTSGVAETVSFQALVDPSLDVGDGVKVTRTSLGIDATYRIDRLDIPLDPETPMSVVARTRRVAG